MTVRQLIALLSQLDPDLTVTVWTGYDSEGTVPIDKVLVHDGSVLIE